MPRHAGVVTYRQRITNIVAYIGKVYDTNIVVFLARKQGLEHISWMNISQRMGVGIPPPETQIKTANRSVLVVNQNNLSQGQ